MKPYVICIIDDDDIYQFTMKKTLELNKMARKLLVFSDGEEAIEFMHDNLGNKSELPDVIFLDINMPIMDGFQFMEEYAKLKPIVVKKIIIYMVTSSVDEADITRANKIGEISDYIIKPIKAEQLKDIIDKLEEEGLI